MLSHELRNPLAPIRLAVNMLQRIGSQDRETQELRDIIDRQATQLGRLLDDLLDVSRITSGQIVLRKERVRLNDAVQSAVETSRPMIDSMSHELQIEMPNDPIEVDADLGRLSQVFANLLNNAAKYTERGGRISITAAREGGDAVVRVRDNGIGISAEHLPRIFEMFMQVDQSLERGQGGLGVGLSLSKKVIELHGGTLEAHSAGLGKGSSFTVRLPALASEAAPKGAPATRESAAANGGRYRILVADDNVDSATMLAVGLRLKGHDVRTVHDGLSALSAAEEFAPDLAILDIGMPKLNGYEVARQLRAQPRNRIVLIAITGWGQEEDKRRAVEAGFDHHLTKPVDLRALEQIVESLATEAR
jgi:CheY-like chemotaxis protein